RGPVPGGLHLHGFDVRPEYLHPRQLRRGLRQTSAGGGLGAGDPDADGRRRVETADAARLGQGAGAAGHRTRTAGCHLRTHREDPPAMTATRMTGRKHFTVEQANATLPLVRATVRDVVELHRTMTERLERLGHLDEANLTDAHREELDQAQAELEQDLERMQEFERELAELGVELKDHSIGLIDFPARRDGREVYLCWKMGEPAVAYWHELDAGYRGRQKL